MHLDFVSSLPDMDPPQQNPIIVALHSCQLCQIGILDLLRVHEGSNNVPARGKIVQTVCYITGSTT